MGMAKHDLITKDFALYVVHYFASMLTWSKEDILSEIDRTIKEAKPADAVPVVRCKDCKHWNCWRNSGEGSGDCLLDEGYATLATQHYDFCSYGERREGE